MYRFALLFVAVVTTCEGFILIEDDIVLNAKVLADQNGDKIQSDGIVSGHWTGGIVPYTFHSGFGYDRQKVVHEAIKEYEKYTCVRFVPRSNQKNYLRFFIGGGCFSYIGMVGGSQLISIGNGCNHKGIVMHEMMHAIGFYHEQSRLDRDNYIYVNFNNIPSSVAYNFKKYSHGVADYFGEPYDLDSLMHYSRTAFGNGKVTITARNDPDRKLGQRDGFSRIDARQINHMYKCSNTRYTPAPITQPRCEDRASGCAGWARNNECYRNPSYMNANCPESCGWCQGKTQSPPTTQPIVIKTNKPSGTCRDQIQHCADLVKSNYCTIHRENMKLYCKKSCNFCSGTVTTTCYDSQTSCAVWAHAGHCYSNPSYMKKFCRKSCRSC